MTSRDTEIERIRVVLTDPTVMRRLLYSRLDDAAAALYDAGLHSQPASEPTLDVDRLGRAMDAVWPSHAEGMGGTGDVVTRTWQVMDPDVPHLNLVKAIAAEYQRLSQPADNEAAE